MQITIKVPICSRIGPEKVPILPESPFFPLLQHSTQSPDGKILEGKHWRGCRKLSIFITHFADTAVVNFEIMPTIVEVSEEDLQRLLVDGGLKPATLSRRKRFYDEVLLHFVGVVNNGF